jgi:ATP-dependent helicase/nuclease subunit B
MAAPQPRVYTLAPSAPFLPTVVRALVDGTLVPLPMHGDPLALAGATLYLPTRRACRRAREIFLDVLDADAALLPRIVALGDIDEDEIAFAEAATGPAAATALALPPTLDGLERRLLLASLVLKWAERLAPDTPGEPPLVVGTPAAALALADDLARLIDDMTTREVSWDRLDGLVPDHVDRYWQLTLEFLKIAREAWPKILAERQALEPAARRDRLIAAEAERLAANPDGPVIVAGSTGSMPATAKFIATVAQLPHGAVVLPGLDTALDEDSWALLAGETTAAGRQVVAPTAGHPQFAMQALLTRIGLGRGEVTILGRRSPRDAVLSEALRPAAATDAWQRRIDDIWFAKDLAEGLAGVSAIEAANAEEEALAIAVVLREALEAPERTAALVTPDRGLARRVAAALGRWNIAVDDSAGDPLAATAAGRFSRLAVEVGLAGVTPVPLLALLKHPLFRLGAAANAYRDAALALERAILRGPRPRRGTAGLAHALATFRLELAKLRRGEASDLHRAEPRTWIADADLDAAERLLARLSQALAPFENLAGGRALPIAALAACHRDVVAALSADETGAVAAFAGADGEALAAALDDLADTQAAAGLMISTADYAELFDAVLSDRVVRRPETPGSRLHIFGPLEARLAAVDRIVLGGLTEGIWPPEVRSDPWLSRPMRQTLGLDLPERRIGLSAHDFAQQLGAPEVVLTRSLKVGGAPAVASRFLQRLAAIAGDRWTDVVARGERYLDLARRLDRPAHPARRYKRPEPRPPRAVRPAALSVTEIEHWLRDPYTIYAKHILKLMPLDPVDTAPGAADRGSAIHAAIGDFAQAFTDALPADACAELLRIGRVRFAPLADYPEAQAFWWPRFMRIAQWFSGFEHERRARAAAVRAEIRGELAIPAGAREFRLSARADRIEQLADGRYAVLDFKTGTPPTDRQVRVGVAPQLTLEGAILRRGGFSDIPAGAALAELVYVKLRGGEPPGEVRSVKFDDQSADDAADHALARLTELVRRFEDEQTPYRSLVLSMWKNRYGAYDDLARVKEWAANGGEDEGFGE